MNTEARDSAELLAEYTDQLTQANMGVMEIVGPRLPDEQEELCSLLQLAGQVKHVLRPVSVPVAARQRLRRKILEAARLARSREVVVEPSSSTRGLFIGAAIGSAVALAGGIAYLIRARTRAD